VQLPESVCREVVQTLGQVVSAWQHGGLAGVESSVCRCERTLSKISIVQLLADIYTPAEIDTWLASPHPLLDGAIPNDLIMDGRVQKIMQVIIGLKEGAYT
jgi:uncharacterized protein (DUF2384 family)